MQSLVYLIAYPSSNAWLLVGVATAFAAVLGLVRLLIWNRFGRVKLSAGSRRQAQPVPSQDSIVPPNRAAKGGGDWPVDLVASQTGRRSKAPVKKPVQPISATPEGAGRLRGSGSLFGTLHGIAQKQLKQPQSTLKKDADVAYAITGNVLAAIGGVSVRKVTQLTQVHAIEVYAGRLVERIPRSMRIGRREQIEVRVGTEGASRLNIGLVGSGDLTEHELPVVETMALDLYSIDDSFKIEPVSDREQLVKKDVLKGTPLSFVGSGAPVDNYARWLWFVTPMRRGTKTLALRVSARVLDSHGHPTPHTLVPDRTIEISVRVNPAKVALSAGKWAGVTVPVATAMAIFAAGVQDQVWPALKALFARLLGG